MELCQNDKVLHSAVYVPVSFVWVIPIDFIFIIPDGAVLCPFLVVSLGYAQPITGQFT